MRLPTTSATPGQYARAIDSLMITTRWRSSVSRTSKLRPAIKGIPIAAKYPGVTDRDCGLCPCPSGFGLSSIWMPRLS